jgi:transcriptional regulator with XRE-family HTH domain
MIELQKSLGARIRALRIEKGWTQDVFANLCHLRPSRMGEIERGEANITLSNLLIIASTLETTVSAIFQDLEDEQQIPDPKTTGGRRKHPPENPKVKGRHFFPLPLVL